MEIKTINFDNEKLLEQCIVLKSTASWSSNQNVELNTMRIAALFDGSPTDPVMVERRVSAELRAKIELLQAENERLYRACYAMEMAAANFQSAYSDFTNSVKNSNLNWNVCGFFDWLQRQDFVVPKAVVRQELYHHGAGSHAVACIDAINEKDVVNRSAIAMALHKLCNTGSISDRVFKENGL